LTNRSQPPDDLLLLLDLNWLTGATCPGRAVCQVHHHVVDGSSEALPKSRTVTPSDVDPVDVLWAIDVTMSAPQPEAGVRDTGTMGDFGVNPGALAGRSGCHAPIRISCGNNALLDGLSM
jgi:hypothetical protein